MNAARSAVERAGVYGHAAVNALVLDDWKALTDAHSSTLQRVEAGANLASWAIPEGKVVEIAAHALGKAGEFAAAHAAEQSAERAITSGVEHASEHAHDAVVAGNRWAERTPNQKIAEQHPMNPSTIWDRSLTPAELRGDFKNHSDFTAFEGPATERGGVKREWHHVVESQTADRFGAERVHSIKNVVAIEKAPIHRNISKEFQSKDEDLGLDAEGKKQSLRTVLKDKPWERHVAEGHDALNRQAGLLRKQGHELRAQGDELGAQRFEQRAEHLAPERALQATAARHQERLELHDRLHGLSKGHEVDEISHGRGTLGVMVHDGNHENGSRPAPAAERGTGARGAGSESHIEQRDGHKQTVTPATSRDGHAPQWSPNMPFNEFERLQARARGGSPAHAAETGLHLERDGRHESLPAGRRFEGTIQAVDGDRIVQHIGRNKTITWSREELAGHFSDAKAFDAMVQPGHYLQIGADRSGVVDVQQQFQDRSWQSLGNQPVPHHALWQSLGR